MWKKLSYYLGVPLLIGVGVFAYSLVPAAKGQQKIHSEKQSSSLKEASPASVADAGSVTTLEVLGLGLSVAKFRQTRVWEEIERKPRDFVLPTDPKEHPWSTLEKLDVSSKREADTLEHAASWFVEKWPIPVLVAGPANHNPSDPNYLEDVIAGARTSGGMHWHEFKVVEMQYDDQPDKILAHVFDVFDKHPKVPAVVLYGLDSLIIRDILRVRDTPKLLTDSDFDKSDPIEAMAAFVFVRRDRVDALRPYAIDAKTGQPSNPSGSKSFQASQWLPQPWTKQQLEQFDKLPTLGYLHRPQFVSYRDEQDKPLKAAARAEAFRQGWLTALQSMPKDTKVARVFYDDASSDQGKRIAPVAQTLSNESDFDLLEAGHGFNLSTNLGNIGAASPFVQLALGVMASYQKEDISASINLKRDDGASIVLISPPKEKTKRHPGGIDPLNIGLVPQTK